MPWQGRSWGRLPTCAAVANRRSHSDNDDDVKGWWPEASKKRNRKGPKRMATVPNHQNGERSDS